MRQRDALDGVQAVGVFGLFAAQELAPRGDVVEQLAHVHARAHGTRRRGRIRLAGGELPGLRVSGGARAQGQVGDRGDRGQGLAPEAQGGHRLQLRQGGDLAGRMALQGQWQLVGRDAVAVVGHQDAADAAAVQADFDGPGAGVQGVFQQFLQHGGGAFDDFARGDLADEDVGQGGNGSRHENDYSEGSFPSLSFEVSWPNG